MNYLSKTPPSVDEYYYEEDSYILNEQTGSVFFCQMPKASIRKIGAMVKEIKIETMELQLRGSLCSR